LITLNDIPLLAPTFDVVLSLRSGLLAAIYSRRQTGGELTGEFQQLKQQVVGSKNLRILELRDSKSVFVPAVLISEWSVINDFKST